MLTILITGPESSGKSTLARELAWALDGRYVAEAARDYLAATNGTYTAADLPNIWTLQAQREDEARASGASFVVCDTGPEVIQIWAEAKYNDCPPEIRRAVVERRYDVCLLCQPDLPWAYDPLREAPDQLAREQLFAAYRKVLAERPYTVVSGRNRLATALRACGQLIA